MPELRIARLRPWRCFAALTVVALLAGCSGVETAYRHADLYLEWRANEFFDLDRTQGQMLKPAIDAVLRWHRTDELPVYARMLKTAQAKLKTKVTMDDVRSFNDEARARTRISVVRTALTSAPILATVTPQQIGKLKSRLAKENEDFVDKYARGPVDKQQNRRATRFIDGMEYWVGSLTDGQKAKIKQIIAESPAPYALQLADRQRIQQEFISLLNEKNSADALKPKLAAWIANWDAGRSAELDAALKIATDQFLRMSISVIDTMTPAQREHVQKMLQSYIDAMKELIAEAR
jgi:hypothetical protein